MLFGAVLCSQYLLSQISASFLVSCYDMYVMIISYDHSSDVSVRPSDPEWASGHNQ